MLTPKVGNPGTTYLVISTAETWSWNDFSLSLLFLLWAIVCACIWATVCSACIYNAETGEWAAEREVNVWTKVTLTLDMPAPRTCHKEMKLQGSVSKTATNAILLPICRHWIQWHQGFLCLSLLKCGKKGFSLSFELKTRKILNISFFIYSEI